MGKASILWKQFKQVHHPERRQLLGEWYQESVTKLVKGTETNGENVFKNICLSELVSLLINVFFIAVIISNDPTEMIATNNRSEKP